MCGVRWRCSSYNQQGAGSNKIPLSLCLFFFIQLIICYVFFFCTATFLLCSSTWWGQCWSPSLQTKVALRRLCAAVWKAPPSWTLRSFTASPSFTPICWTSAVRKNKVDPAILLHSVRWRLSNKTPFLPLCRDLAAVLWPFPALVQGVLPGAHHGPQDPVPHRDVHALDPHRPHPGDKGSFHDGVRIASSVLCVFCDKDNWPFQSPAPFSAVHQQLGKLGRAYPNTGNEKGERRLGYHTAQLLLVS